MNILEEFSELNLKKELVDALKNIGFNKMTEAQQLSIPVMLNNKDVIVRAKTGSGKTGAFLVPILQRIEHRGHLQAIIIVPTRELALQVSGVANKLSGRYGPKIAIVYGGASINVQTQSLRNGADIVVGTPGRIIDLMERGSLRIDRIRFLVLDEADLMLDMGFIDDIQYIISMAPSDRQTMLFSATMPREIADIARKYMKADTVRLTVGREEDITVDTITHGYFVAGGRVKLAALLAYIEKTNPRKCIIFTSTQRESEYVHRFLNSNGLEAIVMHGGLTQAMRERSLRAFREHVRFLISTNLASRGLDIQDVTDIINFDAPDDPKIYVHRVGRSARMGKDGRAFTIFGHEQQELMNATKRLANVNMEHVSLDVQKFKDAKLPEMNRYRGIRSGGNQRPFNRSDRTDRHGRRDHNPRRSHRNRRGHMYGPHQSNHA